MKNVSQVNSSIMNCFRSSRFKRTQSQRKNLAPQSLCCNYLKTLYKFFCIFELNRGGAKSGFEHKRTVIVSLSKGP